MSAHDVTFTHRRFALKGDMTADFKKAAMNSHPLISSIRVLSCKEAGSDKEVLAWSEDVNWDAFNWAGARVKLFCDGWVNEFVVADSGSTPEHVTQDKYLFDCMVAANVTVEKSISVEYPENEDYLEGLVLCLWHPVNISSWTYPVFKLPNDEVIKAYEKYAEALEGVCPDFHLYHMGGSVNNDGERTYSFKEALCEGKYDEYGLSNADILSKNCGCPRSRYILRSVTL